MPWDQLEAKLTFQALRMFLNQEMQQMDALLEAACETRLGFRNFILENLANFGGVFLIFSFLRFREN